MRLFGTVMFLIAAVGFIIYPIAYHFTSGGLWRYSRVGRALMAFMGVLGLVMALGLAAIFFGPLPSPFRAVIWAVIACVTWWQVWTLFAVRLWPSRHSGHE